MSTIFLDRDDTLVRCLDLPEAAWAGGRRGDTGDPRWVEPLAGTVAACQRLVQAGHDLIVITNQGAVARGHITLKQVAAVNRRTMEIFLDRDGRPLIRACYACPFHPVSPEGPFHREHPWRKPAGGMIRAAARELGVDLSRSWMIGDAARDAEAGVDAGIPRERCWQVGPEGDFPDLPAAADAILAMGDPGRASGVVAPAGAGLGGAVGAGIGSAKGPAAGGSSVAGAATPVVSVTLRALRGTPLEDSAVRGMVLSTAHAIAERTGVVLVSVEADADRVTATLATHRLAAIGFGAELRRLTNRWHDQKFGGLLWADPSSEW